MRGTRARRAAQKLVVALFFFLESECTLAQVPPAPDAWHVFASYGQASAPRSQGFAEAATLSVARESPFGAGFTWGVEVTPLFVVNQTRVDLPGRPRETALAVAALPLLIFHAFPRSSVGVRLEGGIGLFWGFSPVPAEGSRFNFFDLYGAQVRVRLSDRAALSGGLRRTHVSNLGVVGPDNPGLSFYSGVIGLSWPAR